MFCFHYFIFFCFFTYQILQLNAFDEEHNDIFAELWQKSEKYGTKSGKSEETLRTNANVNLISQKIGKIKKEIVVKDEPNNYDEFDQFSNERQQKIALNKTVKEENVEKRVKSEFMEFDRISDKEEFDNGKDGEEQNTDSYSIFDNSNLKESSSKSQKEKQKRHTDVEKVELLKNFYKIKKENSQLRNDEIAQMLNVHIKTLNRWERKSKGLEPGIKKNYSDVEKQKIIAEFNHLKEKFKARRAKGMSYDMKKIDEKIAQKLDVAIRTIYRWKTEFGAAKKRKNYTDGEKVELLKNVNKIKKENPQLRNFEIAQMLNIHITTLNLWDKKYKIILEPGLRKNYSDVEKEEIIVKFDKLKNEFKTRAKGMSYDMKKIDEKIAQKLEIAFKTICKWKNEFGAPKKLKKYTDGEKVELLKNFNKIKKENSQLRNFEIAQMLNVHIKTLNRWERKSKGLEPGIKRIYSEAEKQEIIAEFYKFKKDFKTRAKGMFYDMKKIEKKIARKLGVARCTIYCWKKQFGDSSQINAATANKITM